MKLLNPWALLGLLSLPVILGLHLHLQRNRRAVVSSMFLWRFLEDKFEGHKPKFVQISWLLMLDLGIAMLLSLAFAQPVVGLPSLKGQGVHRVILIDDSTSMLAQDGNPDRFSMAKELAVSFIETIERQDECTVITIGGNAELIGSTLNISAENLIQSVRELDVYGNGIDLRAGLALAQSNSVADLPLETYLLSDAAFAPIGIEDFAAEIQWVFIGYEQDNQAVLDPVLDVKQNKTDLFFRVINFSSVQVEREIEISVNQQIIQRQPLILPPSSVLPQVVSLTGDVETVTIHLLGRDYLPVDDIAYLPRIKAPEIRVALVADSTDPLDRAIAAVPGVELEILAPFEYSHNSDYDLVVFRGVLPEEWPSGKVIIFDPPGGEERLGIGGLEKVTEPIQLAAHKVLDGVDLASVRWEYTWTLLEEISGENLIEAGDLPLLIRQELEESEIFIFLPQLSSGNFTKHPAFPIFISSLVRYSRDFSPEPEYVLGETLQLGSVIKNNIVRLKSPGNDDRVVVMDGEISLAEIGFYELEITNRNGTQTVYQFGVNAGTNQESNILPGEWRLQYTGENTFIHSDLQTVEVNLSPWLLVLAVGLMIVEAYRAWR